MENKKMIIKRIVLFCILAELPLILMSAISMAIYKEPVFNDMEKYAVVTTVLGAGMLAPALAVVLIRLFTKEGFGNHYLALNLKGNARYYIASVVVTLSSGFVSMVALGLYVSRRIGISEVFTLQNIEEVVPVFLFYLAYTMLSYLMFAFGEEWGWRGYLMPKLLKIMNKPATIIVGGIIWAVWHAPLTVLGHNFGTDYPLFPWLGIGIMCVMCIFMNAFMTLVTERTTSIYPACFIHGIYNYLGINFMMPAFMTEKAAEEMSELAIWEVYPFILSGMIIVGAISMVLFCKKKK